MRRLLSLIVLFVFCLSSIAVAAPNVMPEDSYVFYTNDSVAPVVDRRNPAPDSILIPLDSDVIAHITDIGFGVNIDSIVMVVNGVAVSPLITGNKADYTLTYDPDDDFQDGVPVYVTINAADLAP